ncbi:hypothetical protein IT407_04260 [Candidatus Uhrbacteria bacterium]|nr:hypothetical protein [Candidatus Uhrbacteria bacterium]
MEQMQQANQPKVIKLTTGQGCLMLVAIAAVFGTFFYIAEQWSGVRIDGTVRGERMDLTAFGCDALRASNQLIVNLRDTNPPEGIREENRAVVLYDESTAPTTAAGRDVTVSRLEWRNQEKQTNPMTCSILKSDLDVRTARRGGNIPGREDRWSGTFEATCNSPETGEIAINLDMANCD